MKTKPTPSRSPQRGEVYYICFQAHWEISILSTVIYFGPWMCTFIYMVGYVHAAQQTAYCTNVSAKAQCVEELPQLCFYSSSSQLVHKAWRHVERVYEKLYTDKVHVSAKMVFCPVSQKQLK